ncbi:MAG TPA: CopG family transcriptional regulator [Sphingopyxis sp.]|nr:CopG family transcriptional regulator [Sphingopyxis sp.]
MSGETKLGKGERSGARPVARAVAGPGARSALRSGAARHQLFLPADLSERLEALARRPGVTKSSILAEALAAWLDREAVNGLDARFAPRLDRMSRQQARIERNSQIGIEVLALFVRYMLAAVPPAAEGDAVARAEGRARFEHFTMKVAEAFARGAGSFGVEVMP